MSEPEERGRPDDRSDTESGAGTGAGRAAEPYDLSDTGVGLSVGEPNTFEPEEGGGRSRAPSD